MSYVSKVADTSGNTGLVGSSLYGTCTTAAGTAAKVAVIEGFDTLLEGVTVHIKFTNSNTATTPTLSIKSSSSATSGTTAKYIYKYGITKPGTTPTTSWYASSVVSLTYDGTYWQMNDHLDDTNTYVTQTATTTDANYEVLFSNSANNTTETAGARKDSGLIFNPNKDALTVGSRTSGSTVGNYSVAEGYNLTASSAYSHAEGYNTTASANYAHAEGYITTASGAASHAEGTNTLASGQYSHAEGGSAHAEGDYSYASGLGTVAKHMCQHVFGMGNIPDPSTAAASVPGNYIEIVGNGTDPTNLSNARTLDWSGNEWLAGSLTLNNNEILIGDRYTGGNLNGTGLFINNYYDSDWEATYDLELEHRCIYQEENSTSGFTNTNQIFPGIIQQELSLSGGTKVTSDIRPVSISLEAYSSSSSSSPDSKIFINSSDISLSGTNNSWDGTNGSLKDAISSLNSRTVGIKQVVAGTKVVTTTALNYKQIFTNAEINSLLGVTGSSNGNIVVLVENGDYTAQPKYLGSVVYENGNYFVKPIDNSNFTAGNLRINYVIIRFA